MLHRALEPYESLGTCNSRDGSEGKRSQQTATESTSRRGRGRRRLKRAGGRIASGSSREPKRRSGKRHEHCLPACAPPPVGTWQPPINPTAGRIPIVLPPCPRRSAIDKPLLSSPLVMVVRAHTRQATARSLLSTVALHRIALHALLFLNLVAVCVFPGPGRRRTGCCCLPEFPDWLVLLLRVLPTGDG
jgi:hypothetical protein